MRLKPSGIEWLGDIPQHWEVKRLKYQAIVQPSNVDKKSNENEHPVLLCNYMDVYKNEFINSDIKFMEATANEAEILKFKIKSGDVLVTKDSETPDDIAVPALVKEEFENVLCGYHLSQIRPLKNKLVGEFLFRVFQSQKFNAQFQVAANGVTRYGLSSSHIANAFIPLPPLKEQNAIATFIDNKTDQISNSISKIESEIELMQEYRTALISEVVTGKVDLRTYKSKNPEA